MPATITTDTNAFLTQIPPTIPSLVNFVKSKNCGVPVYVKRIDKANGKNIVTLSTGFSYFLTTGNKWSVYHDAAGNLFPVFYN